MILVYSDWTELFWQVYFNLRNTETLGLGGHQECLLVGDEGDGDDVDFLLDLDTILYPGSVNCAANNSL